MLNCGYYGCKGVPVKPEFCPCDCHLDGGINAPFRSKEEKKAALLDKIMAHKKDPECGTEISVELACNECDQLKAEYYAIEKDGKP